MASKAVKEARKKAVLDFLAEYKDGQFTRAELVDETEVDERTIVGLDLSGLISVRMVGGIVLYSHKDPSVKTERSVVRYKSAFA